MVRYMIRRVFHSIVLVLLLAIIVFFATHMLGDPARLMLRPEATDAQYQALREQMGLNRPLINQFGDFISNAVRGDFGDSLWQRVPAFPIALDRLPRTLYLAAATLLIAVPIAILLGIISAFYPRSLADRLVNLISLAGVSIADFWLGLMLILLFAVELGWLPTSGFGGPSFVLLPALTLAVRPIGRIAQVVRSAMIDELGRAYVTTARAKGLGERVVTMSHVMRNAAVPIVTLTGDEAAALLNGAVVIETVFGWPGIGILLIQAIEQRDLPLIESCVLIIAVMVIGLNLIIDISYSLIDPRVRYR